MNGRPFDPSSFSSADLLLSIRARQTRRSAQVQLGWLIFDVGQKRTPRREHFCRSVKRRREFLRLIGGFTLLMVSPVSGGEVARKTVGKATFTKRFTKKVRELSKDVVVRKGRWKMIICHHSGIKSGNAATYDQEHRQRGMENGLAYHFVIGNGVDSADGEIEVGSRWLKQIKGGHVRSDEINEIAIGICLVGNFDEAKPSKNQLAALHELMKYLRGEVVGRNVKFQGHSEAHPGHTACPGRYFPLKEMHRHYG